MAQSMREIPPKGLIKLVRYSVYALVIGLTIATLFQYKGQLHIYLIFSIVSNALLYSGFRKNAIFFDAFIGIFLWLGFWLKLTIRVCFFNGEFREAVGSFNGSGTSFDYALLVASCGMIALLIASIVRERFLFKYPGTSNGCAHYGLCDFYKKNRFFVLMGFVVLFLTVALTNIYFGIYQRGEITRTILPLGLNGVYKWLLLFGLATFSAVIIRCEFQEKKEVSLLVITLSLLESFATNVSLLSRGMILNSSAMAYGLYVYIKKNCLKIRFHILVAAISIFVILFASSIAIVNFIRLEDSSAASLYSVKSMSKPLVLDRWVGIEGVMAVSSNDKVGWSLWQEAWHERYSENEMSFYDKEIITSPYEGTDFSKKHYISLPGILALFFYPGSFVFLFVSLLILGLMAAAIEISAFKLGGGNLILCALIAEVVAYRFASFGYVPSQSYLLLGAIFLNLFILYFSNRLIEVWNEKKPQ